MKVEVTIDEWVLSALLDLLADQATVVGRQQINAIYSFAQQVDWDQPLTLSGVSWRE